MHDNLCAGNGKVHQTRNAFTFDGDRHVRADLAAELAHGVVQGKSLGVFAVNLSDAVAGTDAQAERGRTGQRRNNRQDVVAEANRNAHATELAFHGDLEAFVILRGKYRRMRVEDVADSVQRGVREFRGVHVFHVLAVHFRKDLVQTRHFVVKITGRGLLVARGTRKANGRKRSNQEIADIQDSSFHGEKIQFPGLPKGNKRKNRLKKAGF